MSVCIKRSLPYVRVVPSWALFQDRISFEVSFVYLVEQINSNFNFTLYFALLLHAVQSPGFAK